MAAKNIIIRKEIEGVLYDLMPKTIFSQVFDDDSVSLATWISDLSTQIAAKAAQTDLDTVKSNLATLQSSYDNLVTDAPEAYDTLVEIGTYLTEHQDAYSALVDLVANKVTAEDGKGLSTNDFTDAYKALLDSLSTDLSDLQSQIDTNASNISTNTANIATNTSNIATNTTNIATNTSAITTLNADEATVGSVDYKIAQALVDVQSAIDTNTANIATNTAAIAAINDETTGIAAVAAADATTKADAALAAAKEYADTAVATSATIYATTEEPSDLTENDLWLAIQE